MEMVLHRDYVLPTTKGHRIAFVKGVKTFVPKNCIAEAVAIGAVEADTGTPPDPLEDIKMKNMGPEEPTERRAAMFAVFDRLCAANARDDFTAASVPTLLAVNRELGWDTDGKERNVAWQAYHDRKSAEGN